MITKIKICCENHNSTLRCNYSISIVVYQDLMDTSTKFINKMAIFAPFELCPSIGLAISGGGDSMALLLLLREWTIISGAKIIALTVDHKLRQESAQEAQYVKQVCKDLGVEHHIIEWHHSEKIRYNLQSEARKFRYDSLTGFCKKHQIMHLAVAHNLEDQAETFLMNLNKGSGLDGLSAMPSATYRNGIRIVRPLLEFSRQELREYLLSNHVEWVDDPSNDNERFNRVRLRNLVANDEIFTKRIALSASHLGAVRLVYEKHIAELLANVVTLHQAGFCTMDFARFLSLKHDDAVRILMQVTVTIGNNKNKPRFESLLAVFERVKLSRQGKIITFNNCNIVRHQKELFVYKEVMNDDGEQILQRGKSLLWNGHMVCSQMDGLRITYPTVEDWSDVREELGRDKSKFSMIKRVFYSLPVLKDLEKLTAIPYLRCYRVGDEKDYEIYFKPRINLTSFYFNA